MPEKPRSSDALITQHHHPTLPTEIPESSDALDHTAPPLDTTDRDVCIASLSVLVHHQIHDR